MKKLLFFAAVLMTSCSSVKVAYDFDKQVDFTKFKTYAFTEDVAKLPVDELNRNRIIETTEKELAGKGFTKSDNPDVLIDIFLTAKKRTEAVANTSGAGGYRGYGRYGYGGGFSTTTIDYNEYIDGTLLINMVDKSTEKIAWQGRGTKTIDEDASAAKRESNINYAIK
ncbi:MAG TPA: DUF4136 domain-containing protein, partial [Cyclobacteriaceae bacterium]|nr:DUF4136 domain-containing protein [Cyclobacteriaceae bacterium]